VSEAHSCPDTDCHKKHGKVVYKSNKAHCFAMPKATFGLDVVAFVGFERSRNKRTFGEIYQELVKKEVPISPREVNYLYRNYECLIRCSLPERLKQLKPIFIKNGGIILITDGLQPQIGNDVLFILRDVLSGEVLQAEVLHETDTTAMERLFKIIRDSDIHVKGIISDGQKSIRAARDSILPYVPYQLCTVHYFKDLGKPTGEEDGKLFEEVKKTAWSAPY